MHVYDSSHINVAYIRLCNLMSYRCQNQSFSVKTNYLTELIVVSFTRANVLVIENESKFARVDIGSYNNFRSHLKQYTKKC